jgi:hypothetical protein
MRPSPYRKREINPGANDANTYSPQYNEHKDFGDVEVVYSGANGRNYVWVYFRTLDACQRFAQFYIDEANKYR